MGVFPYHEGSHVIGRMFVYGDESGLHENPRYVVVAGFLAAPKRWRDFTRAWNTVLDREHVPDFHAKDYFAWRSKQKSATSFYVGWNEPRAERFILDLGQVIADSNLRPLAGIVNVADFRARTEDERRWLTGGGFDWRGRKWVRSGSPGSPNGPYHLALQWFWRESGDMVRSGTRMHFVLDMNTTLRGYSSELFSAWGQITDDVKPEHRGKFGDITHAQRWDKDHVGLQAADLFAYLAGNRMENGDGLRPLRARVLGTITGERMTQVGIWERKAMARHLWLVRRHNPEAAALTKWSDDVDESAERAGEPDDDE